MVKPTTQDLTYSGKGVGFLWSSYRENRKGTLISSCLVILQLISGFTDKQYSHAERWYTNKTYNLVPSLPEIFVHDVS